MPRQLRRDSDDSDDENALEAELDKLQLQYKVSEQDRLQFSIDVQKKIRLQNQLIKNLEAEREELVKNLKIAESKTNEKKDVVKTTTLESLLQTKDKIEQDIKQEKEKSNELDERIQEWEKKLRSKRREVGGVNAGSTFYAQSKKQEKVLENRLDHSLKSFNTVLAQNANLRDEIDNLRIERHRFEELQKRLEKELENLKSEIGSVIENSTNAYDQREEAQAKMIVMKDKEDKDKTQHTTEVKELSRVINHDKKLKEFMKIKTQERQEDQDLINWRKKKEAEAAEKRRKEREEHSVEAYESKFKEIEQITGEYDLDKLVERFIQVENKNYALFNYVNELNNQVELLQEQIDQIKTDIRQFEKQGIEMEEQRKRILKELEQKYQNAKQQADEYEEKIRANKKILDQSRIGIESLFKKINCDRSQIDILLLSKEGVTETNMSQYLGIIDSRTDELLKWQAILAAKKENVPFKEKAPNYIGEGAKSKSAKQIITLPYSGGDGHELDRLTVDRQQTTDSSNIDESNKPLTREELQSRIMIGFKDRDLENSSREANPLELTISKQKQKK